MQNIIDALKNTQNPDNNIRKQAENQLLQVFYCVIFLLTHTNSFVKFQDLLGLSSNL